MYNLLIVILQENKIQPLLNFTESFTEIVWCNGDTFWGFNEGAFAFKITKIADTYQVFLVNH